MANKVKFNLCDVYYALLEKNTETTAEYATPVRLPGAVSLSLDPEGEQEPFFADGIEYYILSNNMGYTGDLELALGACPYSRIFQNRCFERNKR